MIALITSYHCIKLPGYSNLSPSSLQDFRDKNTDLMRQDIVTVLKNSNQAFVRELVGIDPVAVFRWAIVRAYFRGVQAFKAAGQMYKESSTSKAYFR